MTNVVKFEQKEMDIIKSSVATGLTENEMQFFLSYCQRAGLDPIRKQIHAIKRYSKDGKATMTFQTGIDGYRSIAERSGKYTGQTKPEWCDSNGVWFDVWLKSEYPAAARIGIYKENFVEPVIGIALWKEYAPDMAKNESFMWKKMPAAQLLKCAEAIALRKAFPNDLTGLYTHEEMQQADGLSTYEIVEEKPIKAKSELPPKAKVETPTPVTQKPKSNAKIARPYKADLLKKGLLQKLDKHLEIEFNHEPIHDMQIEELNEIFTFLRTPEAQRKLFLTDIFGKDYPKFNNAEYLTLTGWLHPVPDDLGNISDCDNLAIQELQLYFKGFAI